VPSFVFDGWLALSGAQPPSALLAAMQRALTVEAP
jgi:predicted DsbA family dithiol-disulfide isomerase